MAIELLYFDGCPHWETADARLHEVAARHGLTVVRRRITRHNEEPAFAGSPTILVDGRDPFAPAETAAEGTAAAGTKGSTGVNIGHGGATGALSCRLYETPDGTAGSPTVDQLDAALTDA